MSKLMKRLALAAMAMALLAPLGYSAARSLMGYNKCYKCSCQRFEGAYSNCDNCGHKFSDHY